MKVFGFIGILVATLLVAPDVYSGTATVGNIWKQIEDVALPADDIAEVGFGGKDLNYNSVGNWDEAVNVPFGSVGVDYHQIGQDSCKVTANIGDVTTIDIGECHYHIDGIYYPLAATLGIDPQFGIGENSAFVGVTMSGYTTQTAAFTSEEKKTIVPLARLNTPAGQLGPGSDVSLIRDDRFFISNRSYKDRIHNEEAVGSLYARGGELFFNSTTPTVMGQYSGILFNPQKERQVLAQIGNTTAIFLHISSNGIPVAEKKFFELDNLQYDGGSGLETLTAQRWTPASILKSPQGANGGDEGGLFYIYGDEYLTEAAARAAAFNFSVFVGQFPSGLVPLATLIIKKEGVTPGTDLFIIDRRPCHVCRP